MEPVDRVAITSAAVVGVCRSLMEDKDLPAEHIHEHLKTARSLFLALAPDDQENLKPVIDFAGNTYARTVAIGVWATHEHAIDGFNMIGSRLAGVPLRNIKWNVVHDALKPMRELARTCVRELQQAQTQVSDDPELSEGLTETIKEFRRLESLAGNPRAAFS
jgi:hypothetical protein